MIGASTEMLAFVWRPILPVGLIIFLGLLAAGLAVFAYVRIYRGIPIRALMLMIMRLASITTLALILLGPSKVVESELMNQKRDLYILADVSESMLTEDSQGRRRLDHVSDAWLSPRVLSRLREDFNVEAYEFAERPRPLTRSNTQLTPALGGETYLVRATSSLLNRVPKQSAPGTLLLLSDGIDSEGAPVDRIARFAGVKNIEVHTVTFGSNSSTQDAAIVAIPMQEYLYPNESGTILAKIYHVGCEGLKTTLRVQQGDQLRRIPVEFDEGEVLEVKIPIQHEENGQYEYQLSLDDVGNESELGNNNQSVFAQVQPRRMQVLLIEGEPFWDTKFIAQSLRKDERIELIQISQIAARKRGVIVTRKEDSESRAVKVPESAADWADYDVVIFGRQIEEVITPQSAEALVEHVLDTGGNVVFARGRPYSDSSSPGQEIAQALAKIEPVNWGDGLLTQQKLSITVSGKMAQWFAPTKMGLDVETAIERLPALQSVDEIVQVKPNARVLAETSGDENASPVLVTSSIGSGSVVALLGQGIWRWSLLSTNNQDLAGFYDAFWSNMIRWLVIGGDFQPGQQVSLKLNGTSVRTGDSISIEAVLKHQSPSGRDPQLQISLPDGTVEQVPMQTVAGRTPRFRSDFKITQDGVHEVNLSAPGMNPDALSRKFNAYSINVERLNVAANPVAMKMIAGQTGGQHFFADECEKFLDQLKIDLEATRIPPKTIYIWDKAWLMIILLFTLGCEWLLRKTGGLI